MADLPAGCEPNGRQCVGQSLAIALKGPQAAVTGDITSGHMMEILRSLERDGDAQVGWGRHVALLPPDG